MTEPTPVQAARDLALKANGAALAVSGHGDVAVLAVAVADLAAACREFELQAPATQNQINELVKRCNLLEARVATLETPPAT